MMLRFCIQEKYIYMYKCTSTCIRTPRLALTQKSNLSRDQEKFIIFNQPEKASVLSSVFFLLLITDLQMILVLIAYQHDGVDL